MERTAADAGAIDTAGLPTEDRITRDMLKVIAELQIEEDDQHLYELKVVDQMSGPQQLLPQLTQFQPADTPERLDAFIARLHAYPAFMAANAQILRDGMASGLTAPRIVAERTIAQVERMLQVPIESAIVPSMVKVASRGRPRTRPRRRPRRRLPGRPALPRRAPRRLPRGDPRGARHLVGAERRGAVPDRDPQLDDPRPRPGGGPPDRPGGARADRGRAPRHRPGGRLRRRHRRVSRGASTPTPPTPRTTEGRAGRARDRGHRARAGRRAALLRRPAARRVRGPPGRGVQGEGRALRLLLPAGPGRLASGHLLRQRLRPAEPQVHQARDDDLPRGGARATTSRSRSRWRTRTSTRSAASASRMVGGAYVEGWGLYSERLADEMGLFRDEARAVRDARRAGVARRPAGGRHRPARPALAAPALDRLPARAGLSETDAVIETDRYICVARPGADLQDRPARDRAAARPSWPRATGRTSTSGRSTTRCSGHGSLPLATLSRELPTWLATPV